MSERNPYVRLDVAAVTVLVSGTAFRYRIPVCNFQSICMKHNDENSSRRLSYGYLVSGPFLSLLPILNIPFIRKAKISSACDDNVIQYHYIQMLTRQLEFFSQGDVLLGGL